MFIRSKLHYSFIYHAGSLKYIFAVLPHGLEQALDLLEVGMVEKLSFLLAQLPDIRTQNNALLQELSDMEPVGISLL